MKVCLQAALGLLLTVFTLARLTGAMQLEEADLGRALAAIRPEWVKAHVRFLSHDLLRGRDTGDVGYEIAREYVAAEFVRMGLVAPDGVSYLQPFDLLVGGADRGSELRVGGAVIKPPEANFTPDWRGSQPLIEGEGVYVGYGIVAPGRDDYAGVEVSGKVVFLIPGVPPQLKDDWDGSLMLRLKNEMAVRRGAAAVVSLAIDQKDEAWRRQTARPSRSTALADGSSASIRPESTVGPEASRRLLAGWGLSPDQANKAADPGGRPRMVGRVSLRRSHEITRSQSWNVAGLVPGTDPDLKDEAVVFTAHLDHVGVGEPDAAGDRIFNGTHDNALGVGKLLAAAEALVPTRPRRSVLFLAVGAEERGLLGSWYYVRHPLLPIERTVAAINHDGGFEGAATDDFFAFGARFSDLDGIVSEVAREAGMEVNRGKLPPLGPEALLLFRSDHYAFLLAGVPAVYLMDGYSIGGDRERGRRDWEHYLEQVNHQQKDNFREEWSFESAARMAALSVRLAWRLASEPQRPAMKPEAPLARERAVPEKPYFFPEGHRFLGR